MAIVRCKDCGNWDQNPQVVLPGQQQHDPDMGLCRAKLPQAVVIGGPNNQPMPMSFQPPMHAKAGCAEGEPRAMRLN